MYGSSGKLGGRGRGGGGGGRGGAKRKRSPFYPPQPPSHRTIATPPSALPNRLSTGGVASRNLHESTNPSVVPDESFKLVSDDPLSYAMIIRLTPDLIDEMKRVEAEGGTSQIKFDSNAKNPSGNVIDVGGKDFKFTWSDEPGNLLCDIYEERQSGDDGNGLLVETGCSMRKLNVQRILDESTKKHVKMRSEEAEHKRKSNKSIILEHGNQSVKNKLKTSVDFNPRKTPPNSTKEPALKKQKVEQTQVSVVRPLKSVSKPGLSSAPPVKGRLPIPSPPEQPGASASPFRTGNIKNAPVGKDFIQASNKEQNTNVGKEAPDRFAHGVGSDVVATKCGAGAAPKDLQSMLITLLSENPKGMSLKVLEKSIGNKVPNCVKKMDPILKKIANFRAPGRYYLKPGIDLESFKGPSSGSGRSPQLVHEPTPVQESHSLEKVTEEFETQTQLSSKLQESNAMENIDILQNSPDLFGNKEAPDNVEGHPTSSGSDTECDSDSSDSDIEKDSRSKSRSPVRSESSSDSESDGPSSSEEGSDVDIDIMSDTDDKAPVDKLQTCEVPMPWGSPIDGPIRNGIDKPNVQISDTANASEDLLDDDIEIDIVGDVDTVRYEANKISLEESIPFQDGSAQPQVSQEVPFVCNDVNETQVTKEHLSEKPHSSYKMLKAKRKRSSDLNYVDEKCESAKRLKSDATALRSVQESSRVGDIVEKQSMASDSHKGYFPDKDGGRNLPGKPLLVNGKGNVLRREVSELESGELREPIPTEEAQGLKKQFDRIHSIKTLKSKPCATDNSESVASLTKGRTALISNLVTNTVKKPSVQISSAISESNNKKGNFWLKSNSNGRMRRESSSDEDNCSYSKFEKDGPVFKGAIKDFQQYKEYVQEYCDKYDSYSSLNKQLEIYRNDFSKIGRDLELAKGRDMEKYRTLLNQLKKSYGQCKTKHSRLKKIFIVLHEELKHLKQRIKDFAHSYTTDL